MGFIATQTPLPNTVKYFWQMVWNIPCRVVVTLSEEVTRKIYKSVTMAALFTVPSNHTAQLCLFKDTQTRIGTKYLWSWCLFTICTAYTNWCQLLCNSTLLNLWDKIWWKFNFACHFCTRKCVILFYEIAMQSTVQSCLLESYSHTPVISHNT